MNVEMYVPAKLFLSVTLYIAMGYCFEIDVIEVQVGCDNIVNSGLKVDRCGKCGGNEESCEVVKDTFNKADLRLGYNFVTRIPKGATRINITELSRSINHLALNSSNPEGSNYINGNWGVLDEPKTYSIPGTYVKYKRPKDTDKGESMIIPGPVAEDLDVWLFFQRDNPGISYEYTTKKLDVVESVTSRSKAPDSFLDVDLDANSRLEPHQVEQTKYTPINDHMWNANKISRRRAHNVRGGTRQNTVSPQSPGASPTIQNEVDGFHKNIHRQMKYLWIDNGYGPCSKTCAEGRQTSLIECVHGQSPKKKVLAKFCINLAKPPIMERLCNRQGCPAYYSVGRWSKCSMPCGVGKQSRRIYCRQQFLNNYTIPVNHKRCRRIKRPIVHQSCEIQTCPTWKVETNWSECDVQCGRGKQTRKIACVSSVGVELPKNHCSGTQSPASEQYCRMGSCLTDWFNTDWGTCSSDCSSGFQKRDVLCVNSAKSSRGCQTQSKPTNSRYCTKPSCGEKYEWFAGEWGPCTDKCGSGTQDRRVMCVILSADGEMRIAENNDLCNIADKPTLQQTCNTQPCGSRWYFSTWKECSVTCGGGSRYRDVLCLDPNGISSTKCKAIEKPVSSERCNTENCSSYIDPTCSDSPSKDCDMLRRAGLCSYYKVECCHTCRTSTNKVK